MYTYFLINLLKRPKTAFLLIFHQIKVQNRFCWVELPRNKKKMIKIAPLVAEEMKSKDTLRAARSITIYEEIYK